MATVRLEWDLPGLSVSEELQAELTRAIKAEAALRLYAAGRVSAGYAARLADMGRLAFLRLAAERRIPTTIYADGEVEAESATIARLLSPRQ